MITRLRMAEARLAPWIGLILALWPAGRARALDLALRGGPDPIHLQIRVEVDGRPVSAIWEETFDRLFAYHDRDESGGLDSQETLKLPPPFVVRQVLWGDLHPFIGANATLEEWDRDGSGVVDRGELGARYRNAGLADVIIGVGTPPGTAMLTESLLRHLDRDGDQRLSQDEWKAAPETLRPLDHNDDELIGPGELVAGSTYPGAAGTAILSAAAPGRPPSPGTNELPLVLLAESAERGHRSPQRVVWEVALGGKRPVQGPDPWVLEAGRVRLSLTANEGELAPRVKTALNDYQARFTEADANRDGFVDHEEAAGRTLARLKPVFEVADRDADGRLSQPELTAWLGLQEQIARGHVLLTLLDHGAGLFELLDANHDAGLSLRELRAAWDRIRDADCLVDEEFDSALLPHQLMATLSRGHPAALERRPRAGPEWFRALDRNGDGDVSRREFVGPGAAFLKLDTDGDGLISGDEAGR